MDAAPEPEPVSPDALLDRTTQDVSEQAFASLASVLARRNLGVGQLGVTLEELVRELLRPILKAWLDENLPGIVERIVEREVERIVNRLGPMK
jgi:cell pole-organizing protein PopZ